MQKCSAATAIFGRIFTSDRKSLWAECLLVKEGKIEFIGKMSEIQLLITPETDCLYLKDNELVLPGFIDSHIHPIAGGLMELGCKISGIPSFEEAIPTIKQYVAKNEYASWIHVSSYEMSWFSGEKSPTCSDLDKICDESPLSIMRSDCHAYFANTKALKLAKIDKNTPDPPNGKIVRDLNGLPTGVLLEGAMNLLRDAFVSPNSEIMISALRRTIKTMLQEGITAFNDACVKAHHFETYRWYAEQANLGDPSISLCIDWFQFSQEEQNCLSPLSLAKKINLPANNKVQIKAIKIFLDGVVESQTALLEEPYLSEDCENMKYCGEQNFSDQELRKLCDIVQKNKLDLHCHCVGDKASKIVLDNLDKAIQKYGKGSSRHCIAHLQIVQEKVIKRFSEFNVGACFSPYWCQWEEDSYSVINSLGKQRAASQYPIQSFIKSGAVVCFGSDWPVSTFRPLDGIEVAITRKGLSKNSSKEALSIDQAISVEQCILAYTIDSAYINHWDTSMGSLEIGKKANLVVLNRNIFLLNPLDISSSKVTATMIDGKFVFENR